MKSSPEVAGLAKRNRPGRGFLVWLWVVLAAWQAHGLEYELDGVARDEPRALDIRFQVCVRDCTWRIRSWHAEDPGLVFETANLSANELLRVMEFSTQRWATAVIESNKIPLACEEPATSLLWVLLVSHCYWSNAGEGPMPPVYDLLAGALMDRERTQRATWELSEGQPRLPHWLMYWNDGYRRLWDSRTRSATQVALPAAYRGGFTNAVGTLSGFKRVGALMLPGSFQFTQYAPGGHNGSLQVARCLTGRVESARAQCAHAELVPRPPYRVVVQDRRLLGEGPSGLVTYAVRAGAWPDGPELRRIRKSQMGGGGARLAWQVALLCALGLAPLILARWWKQREILQTRRD